MSRPHPVHPSIVDYYLELLPGIPSSHARSRFKAVLDLRRLQKTPDPKAAGTAPPAGQNSSAMNAEKGLHDLLQTPPIWNRNCPWRLICRCWRWILTCCTGAPKAAAAKFFTAVAFLTQWGSELVFTEYDLAAAHCGCVGAGPPAAAPCCEAKPGVFWGKATPCWSCGLCIPSRRGRPVLRSALGGFCWP